MKSPTLFAAILFGLFLTWLHAMQPRRERHTIFNVPEKRQKLNPCVDTSECPSNQVCTQTGQTDLIVDGTPVPSGSFCLPPDMPPCDPSGGRLVHADGHWQCVCPFPDIFSGPECSNMVACGPNGTCVARDGTPYEGGGNPYDLGLSCQCAPGFVSLPGDPLMCHPDPCLPGGTFDGKKCQCRDNFVESNVDGKCRQAPCEWGSDQRCKCGPGLVSVSCQSEFFKRPEDITEMCLGNPAGSYCRRACECQNGGIPHATETFPGKFDCHCEGVDSGNIHFYGDHSENACLVKGSEVPEGQSHLCLNVTHLYMLFQ